ncbi:MAG TPA: lytic transglycosylase domain-containing protein [Acidimicrobiales bacterium]|nr:lytic transglycosylase domain-containing protein [Acidimicrobiales bacterium]
MQRRRLAVAAGVVAVAAVAFGVTGILGDDDEGVDLAAEERVTTTTVEPSTTTTAQPTTTTAAPTTVPTPRLGPGSPLPAVPQPGEPVAAATAEGLADQLRSSWAAIRAGGAGAAPGAHLYQVATRSLAAREPLRGPVYALLEPALRDQVVADVDAAVKLRRLVGAPRTALPPWRIVAPPPPEELLAHYQAAEVSFGVPWQYLAAINLVESRMGRIRGTSEAGAQGPMQFLPATWAAYGAGGDINSYPDAIAAAARYLEANGAPGDMRNAVWNYNHSDLYVDAVLAYGDRMKADPAAYLGYYHWQVYYVTTAGDVWLPVGYGT